jgi:hypothetical protein
VEDSVRFVLIAARTVNVGEELFLSGMWRRLTDLTQRERQTRLMVCLGGECRCRRRGKEKQWG